MFKQKMLYVIPRWTPKNFETDINLILIYIRFDNPQLCHFLYFNKDWVFAIYCKNIQSSRSAP